MKIIRFFFQLAFAIALVFISVWFYPTTVLPQTIVVSQAPGKVPRTPPPPKREPLGGLDPNSSCSKQTKSRLTALIPLNPNPALTTSAYPTFLFYVPYESNNIRIGKFSVLDWPGEETQRYETSFTLPRTPGIVSISIPSSLQYDFKINQIYHWYFQLYCNESTRSENVNGFNESTRSEDVNGFVKRVTLTSDIERQISTSTSGIWYDDLAKLAERLRVSPQDPTLRNRWTQLLNSINSKHLAEEKLVGPVLIKD
ncbi:MAG: DUF928 domain-containing protein [Gloeotrichia echinulata HAB0833]